MTRYRYDPVCDGLGACDVITMVIDVTKPVNDPPLHG